MAADVGQAAVARATSTLGAVHLHVVSAPKHVPRTEVTQDRGAHLWGASVASVALLGGMHHAVDISGTGRGPTRWGFRPLPVPVGVKTWDKGGGGGQKWRSGL